MTLESEHDSPIVLKFRKTDRKTKKLDFHFSRDRAHSAESADTSTLDSLKEDLILLQTELEDISRNI